jgi:hypothetical protein
VGNQKNLPQALKAQIEASPAKNMNKGYESPAKQTSAPELKTTTKKKGGLSAIALANAGRDILKEYGIDNPNMSNKAIADSVKKYGRAGEVRSKVKQGLKKGDNEGEFKGSFGSPAQMKSPAKQVGKKKSITPDAMRTKKEKERQAKLTAVRENSRAMKEERAVLAKRKRNSKLGSSNEELAVIDRLQKKGRTKDLKKS